MKDEATSERNSQTKANRFDWIRANNTIISEMLMLSPWRKLPAIGLIKPNQTC